MKLVSLKKIALLLLIGLSFSCANHEAEKKEKQSITVKEGKQTDMLLAQLKKASGKNIMVVAHRGDWRNAPENSLQAIQNCIEMGVDMVELDVRKTKDNHLVLMHDKTLDRTTTGKGYVRDWTLDSLKKLRLKDGLGVATAHKIPTLQEALELSKDKILVNLDKSYEIFEECFQVAKETKTVDQIFIKGSKTLAEVKSDFGAYLDKVHFMPIVRLSNPNAKDVVNAYMEKQIPIAFEFTVPQDTIQFIKEFKNLRKQGVNIWVNSLWARHNGGHDDEKAYIDNTVYDWYIENNINIIQTDRPKVLLDYLRAKNLHR